MKRFGPNLHPHQRSVFKLPKDCLIQCGGSYSGKTRASLSATVGWAIKNQGKLTVVVWNKDAKHFAALLCFFGYQAKARGQYVSGEFQKMPFKIKIIPL